jgi:hypothetical protein
MHAFEGANLCVIHGKWATMIPKEIQLILWIHVETNMNLTLNLKQK